MQVHRVLRVSTTIFIILLTAALLVAGAVILHRRWILSTLEDRVSLLRPDAVPLRFTVLSRSEEAISARFRFYDTEGREIASFERSWNGSDLYIASVLVPVGQRFLLFPTRVFAEENYPRRGTELTGYYDRNGFPAIFDASTLDGALRSSLSAVFSAVKRFGGADAVEGRGGWTGAVFDLHRLRSPEVGPVYDLTVQPSGAVSIQRE